MSAVQDMHRLFRGGMMNEQFRGFNAGFTRRRRLSHRSVRHAPQTHGEKSDDAVPNRARAQRRESTTDVGHVTHASGTAHASGSFAHRGDVTRRVRRRGDSSRDGIATGLKCAFELKNKEDDVVGVVVFHHVHISFTCSGRLFVSHARSLASCNLQVVKTYGSIVTRCRFLSA